jgi:hypothetical protein
VTTGAVEGSYEPWFASVAYIIHGVRSGPKQVTVDGKPVRDFRYDGAKKIVTLAVPFARTGQVVKVTY